MTREVRVGVGVELVDEDRGEQAERDHALEDPRPRARYRVTIPTQVGAWLKRLLPTRWLDKILMMQR